VVERTVVWTETAAKQRREILKYWTLRNASTVYAEKLIAISEARIKAILKHPEGFPKTIYPDTRVSALGHFSILYKLTDDYLIITAFWDNRQDPKKLLKIIQVD
jgi:plasmid stabilization system protein ParE